MVGVEQKWLKGREMVERKRGGKKCREMVEGEKRWLKGKEEG
jgi:hypothetical protein